MNNDTVLVTVNGEDFRAAVEKRIAELGVEAEEERKETEERERAREDAHNKRIEETVARNEERRREYDEWKHLPWWKKINTPEPYIFYTPLPWKTAVLYLYPKAKRLEQMKSYLPCPTGSMHINVELARELGLV